MNSDSKFKKKRNYKSHEGMIEYGITNGSIVGTDEWFKQAQS